MVQRNGFEANSIITKEMETCEDHNDDTSIQFVPVITCFGDEEVYGKLSKEFKRRLTLKPVEWTRGEESTPKAAFLDASIEAFSTEQLAGTRHGFITKQPLLHLYWTCCAENNEYRHGTKQKIEHWKNHLESCKIDNWLIVYVNGLEFQKPTRRRKTYSRNTVYDHIQEDFSNKNSERVAQLWEPTKAASIIKADDCWEALMSRVRKLLWLSVMNHLSDVVDRFQECKKRHTEPKWSFFEFLQLTDMLSAIFNFATHHEESFACYEKLSSLLQELLSQQDINGNPTPIMEFSRTPLCWDGISLRDKAVEHYRDLVYEGKASFLELNNYIFIRQWQLLQQLGKRVDVPRYLLTFLLTTVRETKLLLTGLSFCVPACWVVSSCLEYISNIGEEEMSDDIAVSYLAQLFDYAREKLFTIGETCHLLPGEQPAVDMVKELNSGLCVNQPYHEGTETGSKMLMATINDKDIFSKRYIALCGKSKRYYENCRRFRYAKRVGLDMARYYLLQKYDFAANEVKTVLSDYRESGWDDLYLDVMELLAKCQSNVKSSDSLTTIGQLACMKLLSSKKRMSHAEDFLGRLYQDPGCGISLNPVLSVEDIWFDLNSTSIHVGDMVTVFIKVRNNMLKDINVDSGEILADCSKPPRLESLKKRAEVTNALRTASEVVWTELLDVVKEPSSVALKQPPSGESKCYSNEEESKSEHEFEAASQPSSKTESFSFPEVNGSETGDCTAQTMDQSFGQVDTVLENQSDDISIAEVEDSISAIAEEAKSITLVSGPNTLKVGENIIQVSAKVEQVGRYFLHSLSFKAGNTILSKDLGLQRESKAFLVVADPPKFRWTSELSTECAALGIKQRLHVTMTNGPGFIPRSSKVHLSSSTGLEFSSTDQICVQISSRSEAGNKRGCKMHIAVNESEKTKATLYLPECGPFEVIDLYFDVTAPKSIVDVADDYTEKHEIELNCLWLAALIDAKAYLECIFSKPFSIEQTMLPSSGGNFLCTKLRNTNSFAVEVSNPLLQAVKARSISCVPLTNDGQMEIPAQSKLSLVWRLDDSNEEYEPSSKMNFRLKMNYKTKDLDENGTFDEGFTVAYSKPLFELTTVLKTEEDGSLVEGVSYQMEVVLVIIHSLPRKYSNGRLFYKLVDDEQWRFDDEECRGSEIHDCQCFHFVFTTTVIPCQCGHLRYPRVEIFKRLGESMQIRKHRSQSSTKSINLLKSRRTSSRVSDELNLFVEGEIIYSQSGKLLKVAQKSDSVPAPERPVNPYLKVVVAEEFDAAVMETLTPTERKRQNHIHELINTERDYIYDLTAAIEAFYKPMEESGILTPDELITVFINIKEIIFCNTKLLEALMERKTMSKDNVIEAMGDILVEQIPRFTPYLEYCSCQMKSCKFVQRKRKEPEFDEFERECVLDDRLRQRLPLNSYLAKPMQRITKYPLIIEQIIKYTPNGHFDLDNLRQALSKSKELCSKVNQNNRMVENLNLLAWLQVYVDLQSLKETLVFNSQTKYLGQRECLYHVTLYLYGSNEKLRAFLFNDFLLLTRYEGIGAIDTDLTDGSGVQNEADCTIFGKPIIFDESLVVKLPAATEVDEASFRLTSGSVIYELRAESKNERNMLVTELKEALAKALEKERRWKKVDEKESVTIKGEGSKFTLLILEGICAGNPNLDSKADLYCQVELKSQRKWTSVIEDTSRPKWVSKMEFHVENPDEDVLQLSAFNRNFFSPDDLIGSTSTSVSSLLKYGSQTRTLFFNEKNAGCVVLRASLSSAEDI